MNPTVDQDLHPRGLPWVYEKPLTFLTNRELSMLNMFLTVMTGGPGTIGDLPRIINIIDSFDQESTDIQQ